MLNKFSILILSVFFLSTYHNFSFTETKARNILIYQTTNIFNTDYLLQNIPLKQNIPISNQILESTFTKLNQLYQNDCYFDAQIVLDSISITKDSASADIFITITPGKQYIIDKISIIGNTYFNVDELNNLMQTKPGICLNKNTIESDIENILSLYETNGFPWATIKINSIQLNDSNKTIAIELEIDEKGRAKIDEVKIEGNKETKSSVIIREMRINPGEIYNHQKFKKIPTRLQKMQLFENVEEPILFVIKNLDANQKKEKNGSNESINIISSGILLKLTEGNANYFDGLIGYLPGSLQENGYFIGTAEISMRNLFGTARKLNFKWSKDERFSQEIGIKYTEPWLIGYPINLRGTFFQRKQDTTYIKRFAELKTEFMISDLFSASTIISQENIIISNTSNITQLFNSGILSLGFELQYDTRDYIYNPTSGIFYKNDYFYGRKKIYLLSQSISVQRYGLDLEFYKSILPKQVIMLSIHGKQVNSSRIEISDMYRLGGTNTLRGYRENQFLGSRIYWSNFEYRFLLASRSFFYGFFDMGYYYRKIPEANEKAEAFKLGYGIGIRVRTTLGTIGISLALGKGDNLNQTKIHFGLINEF